MPQLRRIGITAEDQAAQYLLKKGYTILNRRYHTHGGEIDIIALDDETLVFIEVKFRSNKTYLPEEAINNQKIDKILNAASVYIYMHNLFNYNVRFDVIAIDPNGLRHYENAFP